jgi:bis(5'-nucleosyl)-tetraphosphatase (symmetrical)
MSIYAIGDVQGCAASLHRLLDELPLDLSRDRLWFVGDLVNRGRASLQVLRTVRALGAAATAVLGNHDLHLLARAAGVAEARRRDTVEDVLSAPDREELIPWLRSRPLLHREERFVLVHAGIPPRWTVEEAESRARAAEAVLRGPASARFLAAYSRRAAEPPDRDEAGIRAADAYSLTNLRAVDADGAPVHGFKGPPSEAPEGCVPWFRAPARRSAGATVVFGHWAALGLLVEPRILALDSGCVWGGRLTAVRLADRRVYSVRRDDHDAAG